MGFGLVQFFDNDGLLSADEKANLLTCLADEPEKSDEISTKTAEIMSEEYIEVQEAQVQETIDIIDAALDNNEDNLVVVDIAGRNETVEKEEKETRTASFMNEKGTGVIDQL